MIKKVANAITQTAKNNFTGEKLKQLATKTKSKIHEFTNPNPPKKQTMVDPLDPDKKIDPSESMKLQEEDKSKLLPVIMKAGKEIKNASLVLGSKAL